MPSHLAGVLPEPTQPDQQLVQSIVVEAVAAAQRELLPCIAVSVVWTCASTGAQRGRSGGQSGVWSGAGGVAGTGRRWRTLRACRGPPIPAASAASSPLSTIRSPDKSSFSNRPHRAKSIWPTPPRVDQCVATAKTLNPKP